MPFSLTNAPATFQRFVQNVLQDFLGEFAVVYIDDILIYSKSAEEHVEHVRRVLEQLKSHNLLAKPSKCEFFVQSVEYLGHIVTSEGVHVDPAKVRVINEWPTLRTKSEVRSFLGLANYYRRFIKNFSELTTPLSALVHDSSPDNPIPWTQIHSDTFSQIKHVLTHAPVLRTYDPKLSTEVVVDATSGHASIGAALMQNDGSGLQIGRAHV